MVPPVPPWHDVPSGIRCHMAEHDMSLSGGERMFTAIRRGVTRRPWLVIVSWVVIAIGIIVAAPSLASVTNSDQSAFLPSSAESARANALARQAFPGTGGTTGVIVAKRRDGAALTGAD